MSMSNRIMSVMVLPYGESIYSERATSINIADEGGGEYLEIVQRPDDGRQVIKLDETDWPFVRECIDDMFAQIRHFDRRANPRPQEIDMTDLTDADRIAWIDHATTEELLRKWRFAPSGDEFCTGEVGRYFNAVLKERREADPAGYTAASKAVGWK